MSVIPRGKSWQATIAFKGKRYRRNFPTKIAACQWEADSRARLLRDEPIEMSDRSYRSSDGLLGTLQQLIEHVYETHWAPQSGGEKARSNALSIASIIGLNVTVRKVTRADIDKARAKLLKTSSPATVNRKVAALSKAFSIFADNHLDFIKPKMEKYREAEGRIRRFTSTEEEQALAFFSYIGNQDMVDYVILSLDTGLRQGEIILLRFVDCDDRKATVWGRGQKGQRTKSGKSRSVPLTARAKEVLARRLQDATDKRGDVFHNLSVSSISYYWKRFSEAVKLQDDPAFVPHILRHEFCSRLADQDINAVVIKELAGHSSLVVTQRYIHVRAEALMAAIQRLDDAAKRDQSPSQEVWRNRVAH